jgi:hypothetical protein
MRKQPAVARDLDGSAGPSEQVPEQHLIRGEHRAAEPRTPSASTAAAHVDATGTSSSAATLETMAVSSPKPITYAEVVDA